MALNVMQMHLLPRTLCHKIEHCTHTQCLLPRRKAGADLYTRAEMCFYHRRCGHECPEALLATALLPAHPVKASPSRHAPIGWPRRFGKRRSSHWRMSQGHSYNCAWRTEETITMGSTVFTRRHPRQLSNTGITNMDLLAKM